MIVAIANKALRWQDIPVFKMLVPFDVLISPLSFLRPHIDRDLRADRFLFFSDVLGLRSLSNNG